MQTPKSRCETNSSGASQIISPKSIAFEVYHKNSPQSELSKKNSPRVVRQIKISPRYAEPTSSCNLATRPPKEASPKVSDRRSPRSPLPEKRGPSRVAELESQISQLENDLKAVKDKLCSSETSRKQAEKDADESRQHLLAFSIKLEEPDNQIFEPSSQNPDDSSALSSALHEIERLKSLLEMVPESEATKARSLVEDMESQLIDSKKSEARAKQLVAETLTQLEAAKKTVEALTSSDGCKARQAHDDVALELERMKCQSGQREAELEAELRKSRYVIEEMRANVMDKENELQGICDENDGLITRVEELKNELKNKEREFEDLLAENEKGNKKAARVMEQLDAAQRANAEMEVELRKMKVQSDQWRKAAEAAAAMVAAAGNNGRVVERTGSMDYSLRTRRMSSPYSDEEICDDEDLMRKKNGNVLSRFGVLWKKQPK
ncbi:interactor of constitutive active rops 3 [Phtheirospermum japonicum]|uniref:Interactor of constitutive active rops 3 n=1 Tax=Phtheirospermum japonicum TaxID=374723 RepID=A0A830D6V7_9LAMI|nr:interactor of constitutive active rops 3 [Phtheirospermum japonicum]